MAPVYTGENTFFRELDDEGETVLALVEAIDELVVVVRPGQVRVGPVYSDVVVEECSFHGLELQVGQGVDLDVASKAELNGDVGQVLLQNENHLAGDLLTGEPRLVGGV